MRTKLLNKKNRLKLKRIRRVRAKIFGTETFPRVAIFKSNRYVSAQVIDDVNATTLTNIDGVKLGLKSNKEGAKKAGELLAKELKSKKIDKVVFDKRANKYHGVVATFADSLRDNGIEL